MKQFFTFFLTLIVISGGATLRVSAQYCMDPNASNFGQSLPCQYGGGGTCLDPNASNFGQPLPCYYANVYGCTDPSALNYNPSATINDGSCVYSSVYGCTDPSALNYNPSATINDGSCVYSSVYGCTDPAALNYNPSAAINDGSCVYSSVYGCTDPLALNYNPSAAIDDGSCVYSSAYGCTDPAALNYNPSATINDGSCLYSSVQGCTDPSALNYNPNATIDDGSCQYDGTQCTASSGSLTAAATPVCLYAGSSADIAANEATAPNVPPFYLTFYLLSQGDDAIIVQGAGTPDFSVAGAGEYAVHTLVCNPVTFDPSEVLQYGVTTIADINDLLQQGGGSICGALYVSGVSIVVENCVPQSVSEAIDASLSVYPNPNNGQFVVTCNGAVGEGTITVVDMMGRTAYSENVKFNGSFRASIRLNEAKGTYVLQVITENAIATRKVQLH